MRATEIIRSVLDLIDQIDDNNSEPTSSQLSDDTSRFRQILTILASPENSKGFENSPNEVVSDIHSVTDYAGGGVNGPKHVDDIRVKDPRGYS